MIKTGRMQQQKLDDITRIEECMALVSATESLLFSVFSFVFCFMYLPVSTTLFASESPIPMRRIVWPFGIR